MSTEIIATRLCGHGNLRRMQCCFFWSILCCTQSDDDPHEDSAKFDYKLNMKAFFFKENLYLSLPIWTLYRNPAIFLNFGQYLAIQNLKIFSNLNLKYGFLAVNS